MEIPDKAFHCNDIGFSVGFWMSADVHQGAGDKILPGWTWEELKIVNRNYKIAFYTLWIGGSAFAFWVIRSILKGCNLETMPQLPRPVTAAPDG